MEPRLTNPGASFAFEAEGQTITCTINHDGSFKYVPHIIGEVRLGGWYTVDDVKQALARQAAEETEKRLRAKRLAEAAKEPEPALLVSWARGSIIKFEWVGVRGVHKSSGRGLIVLEDGSKETVAYRDHLLRPLAGEERDHLTALATEARAVMEKAPAPVDLRRAAGAELSGEVAITFDTDTRVFRFEYDGKEFAFPTVTQVKEYFRETVTREVAARAYPFAVDSKRVVKTLDSQVDRHLFRTAKEAQAWLDASEQKSKIETEVARLLNEYKFDLNDLTNK
jgi:hypothetical protein